MQRELQPRRTTQWILLALGLAVILATWVWRMNSVEVPPNAPELAGEVHAVMRDRLLAATVVGLALGAAGVLLRLSLIHI